MTALMSTSLKVVSIAAVFCASLRRRAMVGRSLVIRTRSSRAASWGAEGARTCTGAAGAGAAPGAGPRAMAASMSPFVTRPSLPLPATLPGSTPDSAARRPTAGPLGLPPPPIRSGGPPRGRRTPPQRSASAPAARPPRLSAPRRAFDPPAGADAPCALDDGAQERPWRHGLAVLGGDVAERAGGGGVDLQRHLVGLKFDQRLVRFDGVAWLLEPAADRGFADGLAEGRNAGPADCRPVRGDDETGQPVLHIALQRRVDRQLGRLWTAGGAVGVPLRGRGPVRQTAAARGGVAAQLAGDRGRRALRAGGRSRAPRAVARARSRSPPALQTTDNALTAASPTGARCDGGMPPALRNHRAPTAGDTPAPTAASSLERPAAISSPELTAILTPRHRGPARRAATRLARTDPNAASDMAIATSSLKVLWSPENLCSAHTIASSGLVMQITKASGACCLMPSPTAAMTLRLMPSRSSRLMPGLRGTPAVTITTSTGTVNLGRGLAGKVGTGRWPA